MKIFDISSTKDREDVGGIVNIVDKPLANKDSKRQPFFKPIFFSAREETDG